jgi:type II secretory pathway component GspD/PulD (secretin)
MRPPLGLSIPALLLLSLLALRAEAPGQQEILYADGLLSVELREAPLRDVLQEVARQAGLSLRLSRSVGQRTLSTSFKDLPLQQALKRLLHLAGQRNYLMLYSLEGQLQALRVLKESPPRLARKKPPRRPPSRRFPRRVPPPKPLEEEEEEIPPELLEDFLEEELLWQEQPLQ